MYTNTNTNAKHTNIQTQMNMNCPKYSSNISTRSFQLKGDKDAKDLKVGNHWYVGGEGDCPTKNHCVTPCSSSNIECLFKQMGQTVNLYQVFSQQSCTFYASDPLFFIPHTFNYTGKPSTMYKRKLKGWIQVGLLLGITSNKWYPLSAFGSWSLILSWAVSD